MKVGGRMAEYVHKSVVMEDSLTGDVAIITHTTDLARAQLAFTGERARLDGLKVLWRQQPPGKGGQDGAQIAFAPDGNSLFMTVGDRQRMAPAQDPSQPVGKIIHLTLDGKPAPDIFDTRGGPPVPV